MITHPQTHRAQAWCINKPATVHKANEFGCCVSDQGVGGVTFEWVGENGPAAVVPNGDSGITQFSNEVDHLPPYRGLLYCVKN